MGKLSDEDREIFTAYLDGELDDDQSHALEARISRDPALRAELDAMRQAWGLLDYLPRPQPSPNFTERTLSKLSIDKVRIPSSSVSSASKPTPLPTRSPWVYRVGLATTAVATLAVGFGLGSYFLPHAGPERVESSDPIVRHLHAMEHLHEYEWADDLELLRALDRPELFGSESGT